MNEPVAIELGRVLEALECGDMEVLGRLPYASNATLLARVTHDDVTGLAVYKPRRGESPLWDFPDGTLCLRERAAWVVDAALGWQLVPPTVLRDGPHGVGAVQLFVDEDETIEFESLLATHEDGLRRVALLDAVLNNADRKAGHCLVDRTGRLWAIDHGVTFNAEHKLRTVIWVFAGDEIPHAQAADLEVFLRRLCEPRERATEELSNLLEPAEVEALVSRVQRLLRSGRYPNPGPGRRHLPWPPW